MKDSFLKKKDFNLETFTKSPQCENFSQEAKINSNISEIIREIQEQMKHNEENYKNHFQDSKVENTDAFEWEPTHKMSLSEENPLFSKKTNFDIENKKFKNLLKTAKEEKQKVPSFSDSELQMLYKEMAQKTDQSLKFQDSSYNETPDQSPKNFNEYTNQLLVNQELFEKKLKEIDNLFMTDYRDRQIKHKHLLNFLEKHSDLIQTIYNQLYFMTQKQQEQLSYAEFESLLVNKLEEVMKRSDENLKHISQNLVTAEDLVQFYNYLKKDFLSSFSNIEKKLEFLSSQQILQQKMHAQLIQAQTQENNNSFNMAESRKPRADHQNTNFFKKEKPAPKKFIQQQDNTPVNIPKSWQDALSQLFQKDPLEDKFFEKDEKIPLNPESSERIIEKTRRYYSR